MPALHARLIVAASPLDDLFRADGSPVGIGFIAGIKGTRGWKRPPSIRIDLGDKNTHRLCRTINVCRTADFDEAWETAVGQVLAHYQVLDTPPVRQRMRAAIAPFLKRYGIHLKTIRVLDYD